MVVGVNKRAVGVFSSRRDVEHGLHELRDSGFPMDRVSVVAQDGDRMDDIAGAEVRERVGDKADEGAKVGALSGGALGGLTGLLVGLGTLAIPGIGPIMLAGATATTLATTLAGVGIGAAAGSLLGGLIGLGIPEEEARIYDDRVGRGHYLVILDGTNDEIAKAEAILNTRGIEEFRVYDNPNAANLGTAEVISTNSAMGAGYVPPGSHRNKRAIGTFPTRREAEAALSELRDAGFGMNKVSIIAKDADHNDSIAGANTGLVGNKTNEGAKAGAVTGGVLGGLGGLLVGLGALAIPGVGPVVLAGEVATALATAATGSAIGAATGGLVGALAGLGVPEKDARVYNDSFNMGDYIVIVDGTESEIHTAEAIFRRRGIKDFAIYDGPVVNSDYRPQVSERNLEREIPVSNTNYSAPVGSDEPSVIIIDRRDETV